MPPEARRDGRLRVCFMTLQALGHVTVGANLRREVTALDRVHAHWLETSLSEGHGWLDRLPLRHHYLQAGLRARSELRRALRRWPADMLVVNPQNLAMLCQRQMLSMPTVLMTDLTPRQHDRMAAAYRHEPDRGLVSPHLKHRMNVLNFHLARAVIAFSTWTRQSLVEEYRVHPDQVHVIPPGVDTARWRPGDGVREERPVRLLFVGDDFERKGGWLLVEAFRSLELGGRAELHVVSRRPLGRLPGVVHHADLGNGERSLLRLYQEADVFVLPSLAEGLPNAVLEAAAVGLPVVASRVGGMEDIVEHRRTGWLVHPGDRDGLRAALRLLIEDGGLRRRLGGAARSHVQAHFDARTNAGRILDLASSLPVMRGRMP